MSETHSTYLHHESLKDLLDVLMAEAMKCAQTGDFEATATILEEARSLAWLMDRRAKAKAEKAA